MKTGKLKVVHILEGFAGGTCTYMCCVLPQLVNRGFDVTLIGSTNRCDPEATERIVQLRGSGVKVELISMSREIRVLQDIRSFVAIVRLLLKGRFDVVHTHCSKAGALGRMAAVVTGIRARIHSPHCFAFLRAEGRPARWVYLVLERFLGRFTTRLAAIGPFEAAVAIDRRIVPRGRCAPVVNGLPNSHGPAPCVSPAGKEALRALLGLSPETRVVLTVCRLVGYKGVQRFLEAARMFPDDKTVFLVAGDGELRDQIARFIHECHLQDRVRLLGHVADMEPVYAVSDIIALCSDAEAMPYVLLEAMRARRPIVATRVPGIREFVVHNETGFLVAPQPREIAAAINQLLADGQHRDHLVRCAYDFFLRHHTLERQIEQLTQIYRTVA